MQESADQSVRTAAELQDDEEWSSAATTKALYQRFHRVAGLDGPKFLSTEVAFVLSVRITSPEDAMTKARKLSRFWIGAVLVFIVVAAALWLTRNAASHAADADPAQVQLHRRPNTCARQACSVPMTRSLREISYFFRTSLEMHSSATG